MTDERLRAAPLYGDIICLGMKGPKNIEGFTNRD